MSIDRDGLIDLNEMDFERNFKGLQLNPTWKKSSLNIL